MIWTWQSNLWSAEFSVNISFLVFIIIVIITIIIIIIVIFIVVFSQNSVQINRLECLKKRATELGSVKCNAEFNTEGGTELAACAVFIFVLLNAEFCHLLVLVVSWELEEFATLLKMWKIKKFFFACYKSPKRTYSNIANGMSLFWVNCKLYSYLPGSLTPDTSVLRRAFKNVFFFKDNRFSSFRWISKRRLTETDKLITYLKLILKQAYIWNDLNYKKNYKLRPKVVNFKLSLLAIVFLTTIFYNQQTGTHIHKSVEFEAVSQRLSYIWVNQNEILNRAQLTVQ